MAEQGLAFLERSFLGNPLRAWLIAILVLAAVLAFFALVRRFLGWRLERLADREAAERADEPTEGPVSRDVKELIGHLAGKTRFLVLLLLAIYAASHVLVLPPRAETVILRAAVVAFLIQMGLWVNAIIGFSMGRYRKRALDEDAASVTTMAALSFVGRLLVWTLVFLLILDNMGVQVTALLAGLGIGGIAVALAVQNILGDLFASLSIVLDKPFVIGDFLIVDDYLGSVEHIGLKTTRLRSLSGEQLIFSNSDLLNSRVRNYGRMFERRVVFTVGVTYQTPRRKLEMIPEMIRETVEAQELTRFDRSHFKEYGPSSLVFETVYHVLRPEFNTYMDIQQAINLGIHGRFEEEDISFAYPTQVIYWQAMGEEAAPAAVGSG